MGFVTAKFIEALRLMSLGLQPDVRDQRRAARTRIRIPIEMFQVDNGAGIWLAIDLCDISPRGVCLNVKNRCQVGSSIVIRLPKIGGVASPAPLVCRVAHCRVNTDETFRVGAEFTGWVQGKSPAAQSDVEETRIRQSILG